MPFFFCSGCPFFFFLFLFYVFVNLVGIFLSYAIWNVTHWRWSNGQAMLFVNFTSETFDAFKSKYEDVAKQFKEKGISFLIGDVEVGSGAFQVRIFSAEDSCYSHNLLHWCLNLTICSDMQYFGLKNEQTPLIFVLDEPAKYLKTNLEPDQIMAWINEFKVRCFSS